MKGQVGVTILRIMIEDPETTRPPKGKRGRPPLNKPKHVKDIERIMKQEYQRGVQEIE